MTAETVGTPSRSEIAALVSAWEMAGYPRWADVTWRTAAGLGWTPEAVATVGRLAEHAFTHTTGMCRDWVARHGAAPRTGAPLGVDLTWVARDLLRVALPAAESLGWLAVVAGSPDPQIAYRVQNLADVLTTHATGVAAWRDAAGRLAPLAYAAGLTLTEAQAAHAAGTLEVERLRLLAGLRAVVLPDPAVL